VQIIVKLILCGQILVRNSFRRMSVYLIKSSFKVKVRHDATRNRLSSRQIKANLDLSVTNRRIQQVLSLAAYIRWRKLIKKTASTRTCIFQCNPKSTKTKLIQTKFIQNKLNCKCSIYEQNNLFIKINKFYLLI